MTGYPLVMHILAFLLALWAAPSTAHVGMPDTTDVLPVQPGSDPKGQLLLAQVVFRHGARTPLQNTYWPGTQWTSCPDKFPTWLNLSLYDPDNKKVTPVITDATSPKLPGGCRMGRLTSNGYNMAVKLGQLLRDRYIDRYKLIPSSYRSDSILAYSTAIQRTVATSQGVLYGLYPDPAAAAPAAAAAAAAATATIRVAVRNESREIMYGSGGTCPVLPNMTAAVRQERQQVERDDPQIQHLIKDIKSAFRFPKDVPFAWSPLRDTILCTLADNKTLPVSTAAAKRYISVIDHFGTKELYQVRAPGPDNCLVSKDQCKDIVRLSVGMLLKEILDRMDTAAAAAAGGIDHSDQPKTLHTESTDSSNGKSDYLDHQQQQRELYVQQIEVHPAAVVEPTDLSHKQQQQQQQQLRVTSSALLQAIARWLKSRGLKANVHGSSSSSSSGSPEASTRRLRQREAQIPHSSSRSSGGGSSMPKLVLYSGHDTTVAPLLTALGQSHHSWPTFTSHTAFELWKVPSSASSSSSSSSGGGSGSTFEVRVLHDGKPLKLTRHRSSGGLTVVDHSAATFVQHHRSTYASDHSNSSSSSDRKSMEATALNHVFSHVGGSGVSLEGFKRLVERYVIDQKEHDKICRIRKSFARVADQHMRYVQRFQESMYVEGGV